MIPQRVRLKGFLCYQEEQEITFDGSSLWVLSGLNGSGKSAIFDVVTFALFGHHRGGSRQVSELINNQSDGFEIEFEFFLDQRLYRIRRTGKRSSRGTPTGTQQIFHRVSEGSKWIPLADTHRKTNFDAWIRENIGLTFDTFTSSVLLLQGKAEKLLDSTAKGRFEVLAGIVDLERYQKVHEKAEDLRRKHDGEVKGLKDQLAAITEVNPDELHQAKKAVEESENYRKQVTQEINRLKELEFQAKQWLELNNRLQQTQQRLQENDALLKESGEIERKAKLLQELAQVVPAAENVRRQRTDIQDCERQLAEIGQQQEKIQQELQKLEGALEKERSTNNNLQQSLREEEERLPVVDRDLNQATRLLEKLVEWERQETNLKNIREEQGKLPKDLIQKGKAARESVEHLTGLSQVLPQLTRFAGCRSQLSKAEKNLASAKKNWQEIESQGKKLRAQLDESKTYQEKSAQELDKANKELTRNATLLDQAELQAKELRELHGEQKCRRCGQTLTRAHLQEETQRREQELQLAEKEFQQAQVKQKQIQEEEKEYRLELQKLDQQTKKARDDYVVLKEKTAQAEQDVQRLNRECQEIYQEIPYEFRNRISQEIPENWLIPVFPSEDDLAELAENVKGLEVARQKLEEIDSQVNTWNQLKFQEDTLLQHQQRLQKDLPSNPDQLRGQQASLEAETRALKKSLESKRSVLKASHLQLDKYTQQREQIQKQLGVCREQIQEKQVTKRLCREQVQQILKGLAEDWRKQVENAGLSKIQEWKQTAAKLQEEKIEERFRKLGQAQSTAETLKKDLVELENQLKPFPEAARKGPTEIQNLLQATEEKNQAAENSFKEAQEHFLLLNNRYQNRKILQADLLKAEEKLKHLKLLSQLLGRDRLQLHLVRQAERQVVDHANAVLDRLSSGNLFLRLCGQAGGDETNAKALELEVHNRNTGEKPINVSFLSGSQKFRVAVSLALGIGQYASRNHRPIESVIIDEGFGCLDRNARQGMIQELQNLRTQMRCILLVSHQEEFAEAFSDGYHFELQEGSTVVRRLRR